MKLCTRNNKLRIIDDLPCRQRSCSSETRAHDRFLFLNSKSGVLNSCFWWQNLACIRKSFSLFRCSVLFTVTSGKLFCTNKKQLITLRTMPIHPRVLKWKGRSETARNSQVAFIQAPLNLFIVQFFLSHLRAWHLMCNMFSKKPKTCDIWLSENQCLSKARHTFLPDFSI